MPSLKVVIELWRAAGTDFSINEIERSIYDRYGCQLTAATDAQIEATIKLVDSIMDDRMERLRAKDLGAAGVEDDAEEEAEADAALPADELPLAAPAPPVITPPPTSPVVTVPRTIPRLPPIRPPGMQAAPTATVTPAVAPQTTPTPPVKASRRPAFLNLGFEDEDYEPIQPTDTVKLPAPAPTTTPHLSGPAAIRKSGAGRLPTSRRPAFLDNLAEDDPLE
jgi:hypothetical protein